MMSFRSVFPSARAMGARTGIAERIPTRAESPTRRVARTAFHHIKNSRTFTATPSSPLFSPQFAGSGRPRHHGDHGHGPHRGHRTIFRRLGDSPRLHMLGGGAPFALARLPLLFRPASGSPLGAALPETSERLGTSPRRVRSLSRRSRRRLLLGAIRDETEANDRETQDAGKHP
jgi:hypothetical protein